ncbi:MULTISPECIES: tyrosine-protein phosphatase [unclassified Brenneria]|uniref:tyrosine-protein phosphatase n=1 Tax=unclassified Brenneria TaxID=2634434 RepID=UPI0015521494|nr:MULTISPECIES: tyrosine-protein phosphatase [unclassified Brenneria]MBJ7223427.1 tyrosine-protein phosphatase [Brenneria sp. L3-3C-1]MEE3644667.1 tyrosine-protein phosphatase [Brenneria sp. L3_3C_1]MEE3652229.1 tyrosine-protein phosphatase [Brenneria sp. HEZEL_4_2_4]NPD02188.1 tyrosine-protein phosphatase [Brenneria sp. hezel4-2-4]
MTEPTLLHPSLVPLDGGINFRDLGGNRAADGRLIRRGKLFRSGSLDLLSPADCEQLAGVPVTDILDYRDPDEIALKPDILWSGANYHPFPANPLRHEVTANLDSLGSDVLETFDSQAFMLELYRRLPFDNSAYRHLVSLLLQPDNGALVQHCAVGKDRTGMGSALVMLALGADEQTVIEDYLLTDTTLTPFRQQLMAHLSQTMSDKALGQFAYVLSVQEAFISTALQAIYERHGSVDSWLEAEYGLDNRARQFLQDKYLI